MQEAQAGVKIAGRHISNLRYADDTILMAESKEELKNLLMKVKEESEEAGLKLNIQKMIMVSGPITSWQIDEEMMETVTDFIFFIILGSKITADGDYCHEIKRRLLLGRKAMTSLDSILKSRDIADKGLYGQDHTVVMCGCEKVKVKVTQLGATLCDLMDYTVHGILQSRILGWAAVSFSRGSSQPRDWTQVSHIAGGFFTV